MLNISLRQLRTLLAIVKTGKISHAARQRGLTSPAVTLQLQQLEAELGVQLFIRRKQGVHPTEIGEVVINHARTILSGLDGLEQSLKSHGGLETGTIKLGVVSTGKYFAPKIIAAFTRKYPGLNVMLFAANRSEIIERLKNHDVDVALMGRPPTGFDVHATMIGDHPHVFIASPDHVLAGRLDVEREELAKCKFVVREPGSGTRSMFELFMSEVPGGLKLPPVEMDSNETIKQAVMAGLGIAFISGHTIEQESQAGRIAILDVVDTPIRRHWYLIRNASRAATPAIDALGEFLMEKGLSLMPIVRKTYRS